MAPQPRPEQSGLRPRPGPVATVAANDLPELPTLRRRPAPAARGTDPSVPGNTFFDRPIDEVDEDERLSLRARVAGVAGRMRSNPRTVRHGSVGVIGAGVALFVAASLATPLASAETKKQPVGATRGLSSAVLQLSTPTPSASADPAGTQVLKRRPTHVSKKAPVDHGTISGLAANGIPEVALNAYRVAAARMSHVDPGCGIDWALLAGIGREESDHGRFAGAQLHADGTSTPRIIGPALDGKHWDYIPAPGNGIELAGDATYAHALGPMQFIPSTWATYGADANGDGKADIFNINDAALGAARYLCAAGGNLRTHAGQVRAVLAYNHSDEYLAQVLALADAYRRGIPVSGLPVGNTTGALPTVVDTGYIPPVNPAAPTAVDKHKKHDNKKAAAKKKATPTKSTPVLKPSGSKQPGKPHPTGGTPSSAASTHTSPSGGTTAPPTSDAPTTDVPSSDAPSTDIPTTCVPVPIVGGCL